MGCAMLRLTPGHLPSTCCQPTRAHSLIRSLARSLAPLLLPPIGPHAAASVAAAGGTGLGLLQPDLHVLSGEGEGLHAHVHTEGAVGLLAGTLSAADGFVETLVGRQRSVAEAAQQWLARIAALPTTSLPHADCANAYPHACAHSCLPQCYPDVPAGLCLKSSAALAALFGLVLPTAVLRYLEQRSRNLFASRLHSAAAHQQ